MTCREKLKLEHPGQLGTKWTGGCLGCPHHYGYLPRPEYCGNVGEEKCTACWDREIPETESPKDSNVSSEVNIHKIIDEAMEKRDRVVSVFISPSGTSVRVEPLTTDKPRWIYNKQNGNYICPECGRSSIARYMFCPNCGEQMSILEEPRDDT